MKQQVMMEQLHDEIRTLKQQTQQVKQLLSEKAALEQQIAALRGEGHEKFLQGQD